MQEFRKCESVYEVIERGGWTYVDIDKSVIEEVEKTIILHSQINFKVKSYEELVLFLKEKKESVSELFDSLSQAPEFCMLQYVLSRKYLNEIMLSPIMWTYPNVRIDVPEREGYLSPAHADDWISFRGNSNVVFWVPFFERGYLYINPRKGNHEVDRDAYWGVKIKDPSIYKWDLVGVEVGRALVFRSDLLHMSTNVFTEKELRITAQLRYEDLGKIKKPFVRAVSQKINKNIIEKQELIISRGGWKN